MEFRHFRYFMAVAEELSFTRAAKRLGIKQPPLSAQIRRLEADIGAPLFHRTSRAVELTPAGKLFFEEAKAILEQVDNTKRSVQRRARGEAGELRIGFAGGSYFNPIVLSIIREYRAKFPDVALIPVQTNSVMLIARVEAGEIDIAFVRWLKPAEGDIAFEPLLEEELLAVLPAAHPLARGKSVALAALAKEKFLMFPRKLNLAMNDRIVAACKRAGFKPSLAVEVPDAVSMVALAAAGFGVALVAKSVGQLQLDGVKFLPLSGEHLSFPIRLAYRPDSASSALSSFRQIARRVAEQMAKS
jgi:DNA-binding transcriptional LysR family regulator